MSPQCCCLVVWRGWGFFFPLLFIRDKTRHSHSADKTTDEDPREEFYTSNGTVGSQGGQKRRGGGRRDAVDIARVVVAQQVAGLEHGGGGGAGGPCGRRWGVGGVLSLRPALVYGASSVAGKLGRVCVCERKGETALKQESECREESCCRVVMGGGGVGGAAGVIARAAQMDPCDDDDETGTRGAATCTRSLFPFGSPCALGRLVASTPTFWATPFRFLTSERQNVRTVRLALVPPGAHQVHTRWSGANGGKARAQHRRPGRRQG